MHQGRRLVCAKWSSQNIKGQPSRRRKRLTNFKLARKRDGVEEVGGGYRVRGMVGDRGNIMWEDEGEKSKKKKKNG